MTKRVLIIGGYGNFGSYIARRLSEDSRIQIIVAGRSLEKAKSFCSTLTAANAPVAASLDITTGLSEGLTQLAPDIVIHTSGPFQGQDHHVARACIAFGSHYIDLADGRDFVTGISALNDEATRKDLLIVSGASSVPCLSSCLIDHYQDQFDDLQEVDYAITTAQRTNRGLATTAAILSYAGKPFDTLQDGHTARVHGWQNLRRRNFMGLGRRWLGNCDVPDLTLFPGRYPGLQTLRFQAGLELSVLHLGLWGLTWFTRLGLLPPLDRFASLLLKASFLFDRFGTDASGFTMRLSGTSGASATRKDIQFDLVARAGDGPFIPCMPAILLAKKLSHDNITTRGAMACVGLISLDEYLDALEPLDISWAATP